MDGIRHDLVSVHVAGFASCSSANDLRLGVGPFLVVCGGGGGCGCADVTRAIVDGADVVVGVAGAGVAGIGVGGTEVGG